jgi:hypothetical protein
VPTTPGGAHQFRPLTPVTDNRSEEAKYVSVVFQDGVARRPLGAHVSNIVRREHSARARAGLVGPVLLFFGLARMQASAASLLLNVVSRCAADERVQHCCGVVDETAHFCK